MRQAEILFFREGIKYQWPKQRQLRAWLQVVVTAEGKQLRSLRLILCSSEKQQSLNKTYLKHEGDTDVIAFDLREGSVGDIDGEVYISLPQLQLQAKTLRVPLFWELTYVLLHGLLHLCGYDDTAEEAKQEMRAVEDRYMKVLTEQLQEPKKLWHVSRET